MRDKYANKSPFMQIIHRYTGIIVLAIILPIIIFIWYDYDSNQMFFESWGCSTIYSYILLDRIHYYKTHDELTELEHVRLHEILKECETEPSGEMLIPLNHTS